MFNEGQKSIYLEDEVSQVREELCQVLALFKLWHQLCKNRVQTFLGREGKGEKVELSPANEE